MYFPRIIDPGSGDRDQTTYSVRRRHRRRLGEHRQRARGLEGAGGHRRGAHRRIVAYACTMTTAENGEPQPAAVSTACGPSR